MQKAVTAFILVMTFAFCGSAASAAEVRLAEDGKPMAAIVIPDAPGDTEEFAASELQSYLEKITGAELPVKAESELGRGEAFISVGRTRLAAGARERLAGELPDAFVVESVPGGIVLAGGGDGGRSPGTLFVVYDFLERELGCRWMGAGELWEHVPRMETLSVIPVTRLESPAFRYRQCKRGYLWSIKNKANMGYNHNFPFDWYPERLRERSQPPFDVPGWSGWHSGPRTLLPIAGRYPEREARRKVLATSPEWVSLKRGGSRLPPHWLCHSNPELNDLLADRLSQMFREAPHMEYAQLGEGDGYSGGACHCEACLEETDDDAHQSQRGRHSYRMRAWENRVAGLLAETDPEKLMMGVAYALFQEPLCPDSIRPAGNVIMEYTTWCGCRVHGYGHEGGSHERWGGWIERWADITPGGVVMTEYLNRNAMYHLTAPMPRRYVRDMRFLRDRGFLGYRAIIGPQWGGFFTINKYAALRAAWNPDIDEDELVKDYCDHAFHEASEPMQRFIAALEAGMEAAGCGRSRTSDWGADVSEQARRHLEDARAAAAGNDMALQRLIPWKLHFEYAARCLPPRDKLLFAAYGWGDMRDAPLSERAAALREGLEEMKEVADYTEKMLQKYEDIMSRPDMTRVRVALRVPRRYLREDSIFRQRLKQFEK